MRLDTSLLAKAAIGIGLTFGVFCFIISMVAFDHRISPTRDTTLKNVPFESGRGLYFDATRVKEEIAELKANLEELKTIKTAAINDLQDLGKKYYSIREDIKELSTEKQNIFIEVHKSQKNSQKVKRELEVLQSAFAAKKLQVDIPIGVPKSPQIETDFSCTRCKQTNTSNLPCTFSSCFDYSLCSLLSRFSVFVYKPLNNPNAPLAVYRSTIIYETLSKMSYFTNSPESACLYVVILSLHANQQKDSLKYVKSLESWRNNGRNHLLLFVDISSGRKEACNILKQFGNTKAIIATSSFCRNSHRENFDMLIFPMNFELEKEPWQYLPSLVPIKRKYLFLFYQAKHSDVIPYEDVITLQGNATDVYIKYGCNKKNFKSRFSNNCQDNTHFEALSKDSIFNLFIVGKNLKNYTVFLEAIIDCLKAGAIPVLIGEETLFPFANLIDFRKAVMIIPFARITEAHFILRTIRKIDILLMRRKGRFIFETYFSSLTSQLRTILSAVQSYIKLPPTPLPDYQAKPLFQKMDINHVRGNDNPALKSTVFGQNWTSSTVDWYKLWNEYPGGHYLLPFLPTGENLPSSVQFSEDTNEYMPIGNGEGGDGASFVNSIGGDHTIEHFTIVILTYDRELILTESLQRLAGLKYLNRIIVVWNNPVMPSKELDWPDIGIPIHVRRNYLDIWLTLFALCFVVSYTVRLPVVFQVVKGEKNSLNNRFLPYDLIDTEAVLSMDDDIYLRYDEIELAFRYIRNFHLYCRDLFLFAFL